ncbi:choice-of-anchor M domain-containing protein [Glycomyces sp. NPDC048151]|uniref:choice-of-anchor M domain-containing protein n=1 Tax=Glycomyces sp. NPDC048151 TaxID=3364002 RepID=UPI0037111A34
MRTLAKSSIAAGAIGAAAALLFSGTAQALTTVGSGHVDVLALAYDDAANKLDLNVELANGTTAEPADVLFDVTSAHQATTTSATACRTDLGTNWVLPRLDTAGKLWAGWNTDGLNLADFGGSVTADLLSYTAPTGGQVAVYDASTGTTRLHTDPACDDGTIAVSETHHHPTWVFTQPGTYTLTFQLTDTHITDGAVTSDPVTYTFDVG